MIQISDQEFRQLASYVKGNYGINLKDEKRALVIGRLHNVMAQKNFSSFSDYIAYLFADKTGEAVHTFVEKITTNHTFFMREPDHFDFFRDTVLPYLVKTKKDRDLRIWSAGCSSGEEAYTLALIMHDFFRVDKSLWDTKILATDISARVLEMATEGIYPLERIVTLPAQWKLSYFKKVDSENYLLNEKIRSEVIFRKFNLMEPAFPFKKKFDVIFCRNVMIYFDSQTKTELVNKFYNMTAPGGYLFIGHSEALNRAETKYRYIQPAIYRKE